MAAPTSSSNALLERRAELRGKVVSKFHAERDNRFETLVKGKTLDEAAGIKNTQIAEELALPPVKIHCSILAEDAIKAAIADYRKRHGDGQQDTDARPVWLMCDEDWLTERIDQIDGVADIRDCGCAGIRHD